MNRFQKRKLKNNIYKHGNTIMYGIIFLLASLITIGAASNRTDKITYIDEKQIVESVAKSNAETQKLAVNQNDETIDEDTSAEETTIIEETTVEETTAEETVSTSTIKVTADTLSVRAEASLEAEVIGLVDMDQEFEAISTEGEWIQINYEGQTGYVNAAYVSFQ